MRLRTATLAAAIGGTLALGATPAAAAAAADSQHFGDCSFIATNNPTATTTYRGEIDVQTVVYSPTPEENPVSATVSCYIRINGVPVPSTTLTVPGTGVIVGAGVIQYDAEDWDLVELCTEVDYTSNDTPTSVECGNPLTVPPNPHPGPIYPDTIDGLLCPVLATLPSVPPVVEIAPDGDVYVAGEKFWDCPPYEVV